MKEGLIVSLDAGSGAGRCLIFDTKGNLVAQAYNEWRWFTPEDAAPLGKEFDPKTYWHVLSKSIKEALAKCNADPKKIIGISSTSQRHTLVAIDANENEVFCAPNFDSRGILNQNAIDEKFGDRFYEITGQGPKLLSMAARLLWLQENDKARYGRIAKVMMMSDWMNFKLCGVPSCEPSNAVSSMMFDVAKRGWSWEIIDGLGIPRTFFPNVFNAGDVIGRVTKEAAAQTGLLEGMPVMVGGADTQCALVGSGCAKPGDLGIVAGTTMPVQMITEKPVWDKKRRIWTGCHCANGQWNIESNAGMAGFVYKWLRESAINGKSAFFEGRKPEISYDEMRRMAEKAPLGSNNTMSFLGTEIMDINDIYTIRPGIFMFPPPSNPMVENPMDLGCMIRATLENFCFAVKGNVEQISEISGVSPKEAFVTGGLSKNAFWTQMLADVLGIPVKVAKVREGAALGLAAMTAVGAGVYKNIEEAVKSMVSYENGFLPNLQNTEEYKSLFETWRENYNKFGDIVRSK